MRISSTPSFASQLRQDCSRDVDGRPSMQYSNLVRQRRADGSRASSSGKAIDLISVSRELVN